MKRYQILLKIIFIISFVLLLIFSYYTNGNNNTLKNSIQERERIIEDLKKDIEDRKIKYHALYKEKSIYVPEYIYLKGDYSDDCEDAIEEAKEEGYEKGFEEGKDEGYEDRGNEDYNDYYNDRC